MTETTTYEITVGPSHLHGSPIRYRDWAQIETATGTFEAVMPTRKEAVAAVAKLAVIAGAEDGPLRVDNDRDDYKCSVSVRAASLHLPSLRSTSSRRSGVNNARLARSVIWNTACGRRTRPQRISPPV